MRLDWILDVLADIQNFATRNDLPRLAEQIEATLLIARIEIADAPVFDDPEEEDDDMDDDPPPPIRHH